jgi:hypothetical protein
MSKLPLNILDSVSASMEGVLKTESLENGTAGTCPKCKQYMPRAKIQQEEVYYCEGCRVCQPIKE